MNKHHKLVLMLVTLSYAALFARFVKQRNQIDLKHKTDIAALLIASERVKKHVHEGKYDHTGIAGLENDFEFEIISAHFDIESL